MYFSSFADFLAMSGYGSYVWSCVGLTVVILVGNFVAVKIKTKQLKQLFLENQQENQHI